MIVGDFTENVIYFDFPMNLLANLHSGYTTVKVVEKEQDKFELLLDELNEIDKNNISKNQSDMIDKIINFFYGQEKNIAMLEGHFKKTNIKGVKGIKVKGLQILTPNQMLKRLPIALVQIKAGNNSESLLNEIRQIVFSLYRSKEITKKVYNNIIKSIKV